MHNVLKHVISNIYNRTSAGRIILLVFLVGLLIRCISPDLKLFHHDEAIHAWYTYNLITTGSYQYDPVYHGPLLYYLTGVAFLLLGVSDVVARLLPAVFGAAVIPLFWVLHHNGWLKKDQAVFASLFFALSPSMVYFSRFLRHDIFQLFFTVCLLVFFLLYLDRGKWQYAVCAAASAACGLCLKEDMPATLLIFSSFFGFMIISGRVRLPKRWLRDLVAGLLVMAGIGTICYSTFFTHPEMILLAPSKAIAHWMGVQGECRICGAPWYYLLLLVVYELPILLLAILGFWHWGIREAGFSQLKSESSRHLQKVKKNHEAGYLTIENKSTFLITFAIYWSLLSLLFYAYVGEKVPWLLIHQLFPLILLTSYDLSGKKVILGLLGCVFLLVMTLHVCYTPGDLNEPIVQTQNSEDLRHVMDLTSVSNMSVVTTDAYWPLPWYFRGTEWNKIVLLAQKPDPGMIIRKDPDLVIMLSTNSYDPGSLPGYQKQEFAYNYSFSLPLMEKDFPGWYFMRDGPKLSTSLDVFTKNRSLSSSF